MSKSFPEWWKHGQKVRTASDGILTLNIAEDAEYWLTNDAGKEVSVFSADILGPASTPEACSMTTDITELAQSHELLIANGNETANLLRHLANNEIDSDYFAVVSECEAYGQETDAELSITEFALRAAGYLDALVEALEKAQRYIEEFREWNAGLAQESCERQQLISELEPISAAAEKLVRCKGRYHSEQNYRALAALFGVKTPDLPPLEHENVHYADAAEMEIEALRQRIAELESCTVKLPQRHSMLLREDFNEDYHTEMAFKADEVQASLAAASIKVETE